MPRCMVDMSDLSDPFYYPVQMVVTYGRTFWPSYSVWLVDPLRGEPWAVRPEHKVWTYPGGEI